MRPSKILFCHPVLIETVTVQGRRQKLSLALRALHLRRVADFVMRICQRLFAEVSVAGGMCTLEWRFCGQGAVLVLDVPSQGILIHGLVLASSNSAWDLRTRLALARPRLEFLWRWRDKVGVFLKLTLIDGFDIGLLLLELAGTTGRLGCDEVGKTSFTESLAGLGEARESSSALHLMGLATHMLNELTDRRVCSIVVQGETLLVGIDHGSLTELTNAEAVVVVLLDPSHHEAGFEDVLVLAAVVVGLPKGRVGDVIRRELDKGTATHSLDIEQISVEVHGHVGELKEVLREAVT